MSGHKDPISTAVCHSLTKALQPMLHVALMQCQQSCESALLIHDVVAFLAANIGCAS